MFEWSLTIVYYDRDCSYNSAPFSPLNNISFEIYLLIRLSVHAILTIWGGLTINKSLISIGKLKKRTRSPFPKIFKNWGERSCEFPRGCCSRGQVLQCRRPASSVLLGDTAYLMGAGVS